MAYIFRKNAYSTIIKHVKKINLQGLHMQLSLIAPTGFTINSVAPLISQASLSESSC